jgi:hypothetical protein
VTCSYCNRDLKLTAEHLWSDAILRLFEPNADTTFDEGRGIVHHADPTIRDLCADCNSGLSPADTEATRFASSYCITEIASGRWLEFDSALLRRWALKTAANMERFNGTKGTDWWKEHLTALRGETPVADRVEVFFAAWRDMNPINQYNVVKELQAEEAVLVGLRAGHWKEIEPELQRGWALKVGWGLFLVLVFASDSVRRAPIVDELRGYGWLNLSLDRQIGANPFNFASSSKPAVVCPPDDPFAFRQLGE